MVGEIMNMPVKIELIPDEMKLLYSQFKASCIEKKLVNETDAEEVIQKKFMELIGNRKYMDKLLSIIKKDPECRRAVSFDDMKQVLRDNKVEFTLDSENYSRARLRYIQKVFTKFQNDLKESAHKKNKELKEQIENAVQKAKKEDNNEEHVQ